MYPLAMIRFAALCVMMFGPAAAWAQSTSLDTAPIAWGETDTRHTTVCAKRWHAIKIRDVRTAAVDAGLGADAQIERESQAMFSGAADCFTGQVSYRPVVHADAILGARTWVQVIERDGPIPCFDGKRCRWDIQVQNFVEAEVEVNGRSLSGVVYVATPRPVQPARVGGPKPVTPN